jgi:ABC-type nickel/cobalt efflux system permease component RcnA
MLFAEGIDGQTSQTVLTILSGVASLGFAVWFAYHTTTKTLPEKDAKHEATVKAINDTHTDTVRKLVDDFRAESKEQRHAESERMKISTELARSGHAGIHQITAAVNELRTAIRDMSESRTAGGH